jgi:transcriptional regulator with XRE-family HTH domain
VQYFTVVLDVAKLRRWMEARRGNGARINSLRLARAIGYSRSYLSRLLNQEEYNIEVSARFIGTLLHTYGLEFGEFFKIIPSDCDPWQTRENYFLAYDKRRHDDKKIGSYWSH